MKRSFAAFCVAALAALLINGTTVHAQPILWSYSALSQPDIATTNSSPLSWIELKPGIGNPGGNSAVIIYGMATHSFATGAGDTFTDAKFSLSVNLGDILAGGAAKGATKVTNATVNFSGLFNATNVTGTSIIPGITTWTNYTGTQDPNTGYVTTGPKAGIEAYAVLGSSDKGWRKYTVDITGFVAPGIMGGSDGAIQAVVTITPADGPIGAGETPSTAPEPASLVLAGLGLPLFVFLRRRMKKAQAEASVA